MLKWLQGGISAVTGLAEPEYGKEYVHSSTERVLSSKIQPCQEITREDLHWLSPDNTNVETATFYFNDLEDGNVGFVQVIHSNIVGFHQTGQFNCRVFNTKRPSELNVWSSTKLVNFRIDGPNFYADDLSIELNEENNQYHVKSKVNDVTEVDLKFTKIVKGCKIGLDPFTYFGDSIEESWGKMRHVFWPRNRVVGTINLKYPSSQVETSSEVEHQNDDAQNGTESTPNTFIETTLEFTESKVTYSMFVLAFQGMKPHHAAKSWNFINFHSEDYSAVLIEFITPKSYSNTKVSIGIITDQENILALTVDNHFEHIDATIDSVGWKVPKSITCKLNGHSAHLSDEKFQDNSITQSDEVTAVIEAPLDQLVERIDVMSQIPQLIKNVVSGVSGTNPYIYQYAVDDDFTISINGSKSKGIGLVEVIFISEPDEATPEAQKIPASQNQN